MAENVLKLALDEQINLETLFQILKLNAVPSCDKLETALEFLSLEKDVRDEFPKFVLKFLRQETEWLFNKATPNNSNNNESACKSIARFLGSDTSDKDGVDASRSPQLSQDVVQIKGKKRGHLKVNISPVPPVDSYFKNSTPFKCQPSQHSPSSVCSRTPESFHSSLCESPVLPSPPFNRQRGRNLHSERFADDNSNKSKGKLSLGDFIVKSSPRKGNGRRIRPTQVTPERVRVEDVFLNAPEIVSSAKDERLLLKKECANLQQQLANSSSSLVALTDSTASERCTPQKCSDVPLPEISINTKNTFPSLNKVETPRKLDILAQIYSFLLRHNFCDNIMMELHFIVSLLVMKTEMDEKNSEVTLLNSRCYCVQFGVLSLNYLQDVFLLLGSSALNLLAVTPAVATFMPSIEVIFSEASQKKIAQLSCVTGCSPGSYVPFRWDTDNCENFMCRENFTSFSKQRDAFYKLLEKWETGHVPNWNKRVEYIISIEDEPTNMAHLARLFRNQLLTSCATFSSTLDDPDSSILQLLPSVDRGKLSRLEARLSGHGAKRGLAPLPDFHGQEMFFKNFIEACGPKSSFVSFLQLALLDELMRFNEVQLDSGGSGGIADKLIQKKYLECLTATVLLSKFLAFVEFLPYRSKNQKGELPEAILLMHQKLREKSIPSFDVRQCLRDAIQSRRLILVVPWVVSYMAMMDHITARLRAYSGAWALLAGIKKKIPQIISPSGKFLLQLHLGWLFQVAPSPEVKLTVPEYGDMEFGLDNLEVVSENALYSACPYLSELNAILAGNVTATTPRHIRPTPQLDHAMVDTLNLTQLELTLEESFLYNQAHTTRQCVQFVAEQVSLCCIKHLKADILPLVRERVCQEIKKKTPEAALKAKDGEILASAVEQWKADARAATSSSVRDICLPRSQLSIRCLLYHGLSEASIQVACDLAVRLSVEKVGSWLKGHIFSEIGMEEARNALESELFSTSEKVMGFADIYKENEPEASFADCVFRLQDSAWQALHGCLSADILGSAIEVTRKAVGSNTLPSTLEKSLLGILVDLIIFIFIRSPHLIPMGEQLIQFLHKLNAIRHTDSPLSRILCPRNLELICTEPDCERFIYLITALVQENILTADNLKRQITSSFGQELTEVLHVRLSSVVRYILNTLLNNDLDFIAKTKIFL